MKKLFVLLVLCAVIAGAMAQAHHPANPHQHPPIERAHHHNHHGGYSEPYNRQIDPCATREQMRLVMQTLKAQSFDDKKLEIAQLCVTIGYFCTDDLALMASVFSFDEGRLAFLEYAYPYCTDREHYPTLRRCFTFSTNYDKLIQAIYPPSRH